MGNCLQELDFLLLKSFDIYKMECQQNCNWKEYNLSNNQRRVLMGIAKINKERIQLVTIKHLIECLKLTERKIRYSVNKLLKNDFIENKEKSILLLGISDKGKAYLESILGDLQKDVSYVNPLVQLLQTIPHYHHTITKYYPNTTNYILEYANI